MTNAEPQAEARVEPPAYGDRAARARAVRARAGEEKKAEFLRLRGWTVTPPEWTP